VTEAPWDPPAVLVFYEDGSGVSAYPSLEAARRQIEGFEVNNGEYAFFTTDGQVVAAAASGRWNEDVELRVVEGDSSSELRDRLRVALPVVGIDSSLASSPLIAAQALIDADWNVRWPRWPRWLDRRFHGSKPELPHHQ